MHTFCWKKINANAYLQTLRRIFIRYTPKLYKPIIIKSGPSITLCKQKMHTFRANIIFAAKNHAVL